MVSLSSLASSDPKDLFALVCGADAQPTCAQELAAIAQTFATCECGSDTVVCPMYGKPIIQGAVGNDPTCASIKAELEEEEGCVTKGLTFTCPTEAPTEAPTKAPTSYPTTKKPTGFPTTGYPSRFPTEQTNTPTPVTTILC